MFKKSVLMVLAVFCLAGVSNAESIDDEIRNRDAVKGEVKTFSYIDEKDNKEYVYDVTKEQAKLLPEGEVKDLNATKTNELEGVIAEIRKQEPKAVVAIHADL